MNHTQGKKMTSCQKNALGVTPWTAEQVESYYRKTKPAGNFAGGKLAESHERLRAELEGCDVLLKASEAANRQALGFVKYALEFWDWSRFPNLEQSTQELRDALIGCVGDTGEQMAKQAEK